MATLRSNISTAMYNIRQFRGLNEAESGETALRDGEASKMRNFRITDSGALTPRGTLQKCIQLGNAYDELGRFDISLDRGKEQIAKPLPSSSNPIKLYSSYTVKADGSIAMVGEPVYELSQTNSAPPADTAYFMLNNEPYLFEGVVSTAYYISSKMYPTGEVKELWSGNLGGADILLAVANHYVWWLIPISDLPEHYLPRQVKGSYISGDTAHLFGFGNKVYLLTGDDMLCWDGANDSIDDGFVSVEGYIPCVLTACAPATGSGTAYERINNLTLKRKCRYNADGTATEYKILEAGVTVLSVFVNGEEAIEGTDYTKSTSKVTFATAPAAGVENVEITYQIDGEKTTTKEFNNVGGIFHAFAFAKANYGMELAEIKVFKYVNAEQGFYEEIPPTDYTVINNSAILLRKTVSTKIKVEYRFKTPREKVLAMKYSELYNGTNENRIFLYGDGTNTVIYSGLDENGQPTAEYFPDLNECRIGSDVTPVKALVRHYNRLLVFKDNSTYSIYYGTTSLADGSVTAGFYVSAINKSIGTCADAQAVLVENRVRTVDGMDLYEWRATNTSGNITYDQRNADRISQRIYDTLSTFNLKNAKLYYDKARHEFYCISGDEALVQNIEADAWYFYTGFPVRCMNVYSAGGRDDVICGLKDGYIAILDRNADIDFKTEWISGSLDFGKPFAYKLSTQIWAQIRPENSRRVNISVETENGSKIETYVTTAPAGTISPTLTVKLKPKKFVRYKLGFEAQNRLTLLGANIAVSYSTNVK